jgi:hypothetical protein
MSFVDNLTPKIALETIGLRRDEAQMADLILPVLVAFGLGLGIGAGAALLLTPQSGRELRDDLRRGVGKVQQTVRKSIPHRKALDDGDDGVDNGEAEYPDGLSTNG